MCCSDFTIRPTLSTPLLSFLQISCTICHCTTPQSAVASPRSSDLSYAVRHNNTIHDVLPLVCYCSYKSRLYLSLWPDPIPRLYRHVLDKHSRMHLMGFHTAIICTRSIIFVKGFCGNIFFVCKGSSQSTMCVFSHKRVRKQRSLRGLVCGYTCMHMHVVRDSWTDVWLWDHVTFDCREKQHQFPAQHDPPHTRARVSTRIFLFLIRGLFW